MIDPVTAISIATNAFGTIKRMVAAGRDVGGYIITNRAVGMAL